MEDLKLLWFANWATIWSNKGDLSKLFVIFFSLHGIAQEFEISIIYDSLEPANGMLLNV